MSYNNRDNNDPKKGKRTLIWLGIFLLIFAPMVTIPLGMLVVIIIAVSKAKNNANQSSSAYSGYNSQTSRQYNASNPGQYTAPNPGQFTAPQQYYQPTKRPTPANDCPKPICFPDDKAVHHVRRGKEIDPWDRPDIDISKYQRKE